MIFEYDFPKKSSIIFSIGNVSHEDRSIFLRLAALFKKYIFDGYMNMIRRQDTI